MTIYGTTDGFKAYHAARGREGDIAAYDDDEIAPAGLVASEWLDANYRSLFPGLKTAGRDQEREWPRIGGIDIYGYGIPSDVVPVEVENATYELQLIQLQSPGSLTKTYTPSKYDEVQVDGAVRVKYARLGGAYAIQSDYKIVADILAPIITGNQGMPSPFSGAACRV